MYKSTDVKWNYVNIKFNIMNIKYILFIITSMTIINVNFMNYHIVLTIKIKIWIKLFLCFCSKLYDIKSRKINVIILWTIIKIGKLLSMFLKTLYFLCYWII